MKTLKLFNAVLAKSSKEINPFISSEGFIIVPQAMWAKDRIVEFYLNEKLSGNDLNKTFHKSWKTIKDSSRFELFIHQITHYISTYGSDFQDEIYIPDEVLNVPDVKLKYKVIRALTKDELIDECFLLLNSGIALKEDTINDILSILTDELNYKFTGKEKIRNKEAIIKIADLYGVYPSDVMEFFRYIIYRATGQSLLIKSKEVIAAIKFGNYNPAVAFDEFGLEKLAEVFNRFKPLFLAFKSKCPTTINKISKLSKKYHKPLVINPLNCATFVELNDSDLHWLDSATPYALFKAISACYSRMQGQDNFVYRIRNGKSWVKTSYEHQIIVSYINEQKNLKDDTRNASLPDTIYGLCASFIKTSNNAKYIDEDTVKTIEDFHRICESIVDILNPENIALLKEKCVPRGQSEKFGNTFENMCKGVRMVLLSFVHYNKHTPDKLTNIVELLQIACEVELAQYGHHYSIQKGYRMNCFFGCCSKIRCYNLFFRNIGSLTYRNLFLLIINLYLLVFAKNFIQT